MFFQKQVELKEKENNVCLFLHLKNIQKEYLEDYASPFFKELGEKVIEEHLKLIPNEKVRMETIRRLKRIEEGERDLYF